MEKILFECRIPKSKISLLNKYLTWFNKQENKQQPILINNINRYFQAKRKTKQSKVFYLVLSKQNNFYLTNFKNICLG